MADGDELPRDAAPPVDELDFQRVAAAARARLFGEQPEPVRLGRFTLLERLGAGSMGAVYAAYDPQLDRKIAVKVLRPELDRADTGEAARAGLIREAQALARIAHPHVIAVHEVGTDGDRVFIAMEHVAGEPFDRWLAAAPRGAAEILETMRQTCRGLAAAHRAGLVHRDVKPANVLVGADGRVRITDFGLASETPGGGALIGTPAYMAPEQLAGRAADARSDQFGFCVMLHEALCGTRPFRGDDVAALATAIAGGAPILPDQVEVRSAVRHAVARGLAAEPGDRHASMDDLLVALEPAAPPRPRWHVPAVVTSALAFVAAVFVIARGGGGGVDDRCTNATALLAEVWSPERRASVEARFAGLGPAFAEDSGRRASDALDAYGGGWIAAHTAACRATRVTGEQSDDVLSARMLCLERRRRELDATAGLLAEADLEIATKAVELAEALAPIDACADLAALATTGAAPAAQRDALAALAGALAEAETLGRAGRYRDAVARAREAVAAARATAHAPAIAEALERLGALELAAGERAAAATLFEAVQQAEIAGHAEAFARAAISLTTAAGADSDGERVALWAGLADAATRRLGGPPALEAALLSAHGASLEIVGDFAAAVAALQRAAELQRDLVGEDGVALAAVLHNLGNAFESAARYDEAAAALAEALAIRSRVLGPDHPAVAASHNSLAILAEGRGELAAAAEGYTRAAAIAEAALGADHPHLADYLDNLAGVRRATGDLDGALALRLRALGIRERVLGPEHADVAYSLNNLAVLLDARGDQAGAADALRRALAIRRATFGERHARVASVLVNLGEAELELGDHAAGLAHLEEAAAMAVETLGATHAHTAYYFLSLGNARAARGERVAAIAALERALEIAEPHTMYPDELADIRFALARASTRPGARATARAAALAGQARARYLEAGLDDARGEVDTWLADHTPR